MKDSRLKDMKAFGRDKSNHLVKLDHDNKSNVKRTDANQNLLGVPILSYTKLRNYGEEHLQKAKIWKIRFATLSQQLLEEKCTSD